MTKKDLDPTPSLDHEEQWFENQADHFIDTDPGFRESLVAAARNSARKTERMNIRMTKSDMDALRARASVEGLPYQSLVASILHRYSAGLLVDITEARKILKSGS
jgi:predicted DNA binding CopG/RHH family protein